MVRLSANTRDLLAQRRRTPGGRLIASPPTRAGRRAGTRKVLAQVVVQRLQQGVAGRAPRSSASAHAVHLLADGVVLFAELDQFAQLAFQDAWLFSRSDSIWRSESGIARPPCGCGMFTDDSMSAYSLEELRVVLQVAGQRLLISLDSFAHNSISPSNTVCGGPGHQHRRAFALPRRFRVHRRGSRPCTGAVEQAARDPRHHGRAGAGAAGQRFAGAALVHAQA